MLTLNPALLYIYWKYAPIVLAKEEARITLFEGGSGGEVLELVVLLAALVVVVLLPLLLPN